MPHEPIRTTVIGSYPAPSWVELAQEHRDELGEEDLAELRRDAVTVAVRDQLAAGVDVIAVDEPSMSCYAEREDRGWLVDVFNRSVEPVAGRCYLGTHLCFGNYKARAVAKRRYAPMFPDFLALAADEIHLEMASRELAELEL